MKRSHANIKLFDPENRYLDGMERWQTFDRQNLDALERGHQQKLDDISGVYGNDREEVDE